MNLNSKDLIKQLALESPQDFVKFISGFGEFEHVLPSEIVRTELRTANVVRHKKLNCVLHFEFLSEYEEKIDIRMRRDHIILDDMFYPVPVHSVLVLLKPEADSPKITGEVIRSNSYFRYTVVRLWENSAEDSLILP